MDDPSHVSQIVDFTESTDGKALVSSTSPPLESTFATAETPHELLQHDEIDEQALAHDYEYNSSASSHHSTESDILGEDLDDEEELEARMNSRASSRSSMSSLPASVLVHPPPDGAKQALVITGAPQEHMVHTDHWVNHHEKLEQPLKSMHSANRHRDAAFRKPSSVRAMQMHTEDEDDDGDDYLTPPRPRGGKRHSEISIRSTGSSSLKRSPYYSPNASANRQKVKKEFPLVLLHCNLLPPSLPIPGMMAPPSQKILREVLPLGYWRRWKLLEEKVGYGVLRDRGVLISHPEDMYDLLEERLLESLELQRPRLDHGHFLGHEEGDSENEDMSANEESATDDEQGEACHDCGGHVIRNGNHGRKWEIKVFAANGLMRAGAWAAAWKEMEKVDVEVGLWLPSHIRRELEKRLLDEELRNYENSASQIQRHMDESANAGITGAVQDSPSDVPASPGYESRQFTSERQDSPHTPEPASVSLKGREAAGTPKYHAEPPVEIDLQTLLVNYVRVLANDRRNVAIAILGILVVFMAIVGAQPQSAPASSLYPFPREMFDAIPTASISLSSSSSMSNVDHLSSSSSSSAAAATSMVVDGPHTLAMVESESEHATEDPADFLSPAKTKVDFVQQTTELESMSEATISSSIPEAEMNVVPQQAEFSAADIDTEVAQEEVESAGPTVIELAVEWADPTDLESEQIDTKIGAETELST